ncbi:hypothetical protein GTY41_30600 [Streptomyces sp. SID685]|nr:YwqJ-related putative deaminase [Streptomyces sp. SID685]MYR89145.1 hypothetical protein [Streptomyces sp. SID685]
MSDQFPAVASSLLVNGAVLSHTSVIGSGQLNLHPSVRGFIESLPQDERRSYTGRCAEMALVSDQFWQLDAERTDGRTTAIREATAHFEGAALISRMVREPGNPDHGRPTEPCPVCSALLSALGIQVIE